MEHLILFVFKIWFPHRWHWFSCCMTLFGSYFAQKEMRIIALWNVRLLGLYSAVWLTTSHFFVPNVPSPFSEITDNNGFC